LGRVISPSEFPWNWNTAEEIHQIDERFINKESLRYPDILRNDYNIFFDRSILSHLTYAYAYWRYKGLSSFVQTVKLYEKSLADWSNLLPDYILNIQISPDISIQRQLQRTKDRPQKALPEFRRNEDFLNDLLCAYSKVFECFDWKIIHLDGNLSTEDQLEYILNFDFSEVPSKQLDLKKYLHFF
jgi:thymidylate kinase